MKELKLLCWNVNGIRAIGRKGFLEWLYKESPDILCLQETRASPEQLDKELESPRGYHTYWNSPKQGKGYSGVATFAKEKPLRVQRGFGNEEFDAEGRTIIIQYPGFTIFNIYFPNGKQDQTRLNYKIDFYDAFLSVVNPLKEAGAKLIVCGDFNTAHKEIDLARPKENQNISGFLPIERSWMDKFVSHGFVDTFRQFNTEPHQYTWWDMKTSARERNIGWRIDYFFVTENMVESVAHSFIMPEVRGSDHCPVGIVMRIP